MPKMPEIELSDVGPSEIGVIRKLAESTGIDVWSSEGYAGELDRADSIFRKAAADGRIVGFYLARRVAGIDGQDVELYSIAVDDRLRRSGLGSRLLLELIETSRRLTVGSIWLEVRRNNLGALRFYERFGFKRVAVRPNFYADPLDDAYVMRLEINGKAPANVQKEEA